MAVKRFSAEQMIIKLREAEVGLARTDGGPGARRQIAVTDSQTYYRWRTAAVRRGLRLNQAKRRFEGRFRAEARNSRQAFGRSSLDAAAKRTSWSNARSLKEVSSVNACSRPDALGPRAFARCAVMGEIVGKIFFSDSSSLPSAGTRRSYPAKGKAYPRSRTASIGG